MGLFCMIIVGLISSVIEVQQYREIAARSSGYFIIADLGPVYREIPDEYTDLGDKDWGLIGWRRPWGLGGAVA